MKIKSIISLVICVILLFVVVGSFNGLVGKNEATNWQIIQSVGGSVSIRDNPGWYVKWFATVTTYPRYVSKRWNDEADDGSKAIESIRTTFNDGGTAQISTDIRYATPSSDEQRKIFHQQFGGNVANATTAVKSHLTNCIKATGPLMSSSEHQSARKAEFTQLAENQTTLGLYAMERIEKLVTTELTVDEIEAGLQPKVEVVLQTKLRLDKNGMPKIEKVSPLQVYGISVLQFSITKSEYDKETLKQFAAKKQAFLAAEQSKADKIKYAQAKLATDAEYAQQIAVEKGKAEMQKMKMVTDAEREKELAEIDAQKNVEVALLVKQERETKSEMNLSVAEIEKKAALTVASQNFEVAQIKATEAEEEKKAIISLAEGKEKAIELSGAITEREQVLAEIAAQRDVDISEFLATIQAPGTIFMGGGGGSGADGGMGQGWFGNVMAYAMSMNAGLIPQPMASPLDNRTAPVK